MLKKVPKHPKIVLLANNIVGYQIAKYFAGRHEHIVALVLNAGNKALLRNKIMSVAQSKNIYTEHDLLKPIVIRKIKSLHPDIGVCAFFGTILKKEFINLFPCGVINCHNGYLPYNRGKYPHVWALAKGTPYGVSVHYVDEGIDTGDIIARRRIIPSITDTGGSLYDKSLNAMTSLFVRTWPYFLKNKTVHTKQNSKVASHHFAREVEKLDFIDINSQLMVGDLINQIRARSFADRSYSYFISKGKKIFVKIALSKSHYLL